jgi:cation diffusion facilitator family transporter
VAWAGHGVCFRTGIDQIQHPPNTDQRGSRKSSQRSRIVVYAAAAANLAIAAIKFVVAAASGSSSLLSEGFHSLADCGNELLILVGIGRSGRPADRQYPFGYSRELYFWSFIVALLLFGGGACTSIYQGVARLRNPVRLGDPFWAYVVIGAAVVFEGGSFLLAWREMRRRPIPGALWQQVHRSKDPAVFFVLIEDSAALVGLLVAAAGVFLSHTYANPAFDACASVVIGVILACAALALAFESRSLLLGESASPAIVDDIGRIVASDPRVRAVRPPLTMQLGPRDILLNLDVEFRDDITAKDHLEAIYSLEDAIRRRHPAVQRIYIEARRPRGNDN